MAGRIFLVTMLALAMGCGDDGDSADGDGVTIDGPAGARVVEATCPVGPAATITTNTAGNAYTPEAATISANGIVKFTMPSSHNVVPASATDDPGLRVGFNQEKCLQFTTAGSYRFKCEPHGFTGTITVQ